MSTDIQLFREDTYIGRLTSQGRQKPRFDIEQLSCHQRIEHNISRPSNAVEVWSSKFVKVVNSKHPKSLRSSRTKIKNAKILLEKLCAGKKIARPKKFHYQKLN